MSPANSLRLSGKGLGLDLDLVEHLQQKVESLTGEKNSYEELSKKTEQELKQFKKNYQEVNQLARGLKEELAKTKVLSWAVNQLLQCFIMRRQLFPNERVQLM